MLSIFRRLSSKTVYKGRWLNLNKKYYLTSTGEVGTWEFVSRPERFKQFDGVKVIATMLKDNSLCLLTVAVYRHPLDKYVLELPAGRIERDDTASVSAAIRELKEETGYTAFHDDAYDVGPITYNDPWKSDECTRTVLINVDCNIPENQIPEQDLDSEEHINVHLLPMNNLAETVQKLALKNGYQIDSRLYFFAQGLNFMFSNF